MKRDREGKGMLVDQTLFSQILTASHRVKESQKLAVIGSSQKRLYLGSFYTYSRDYFTDNAT